MKRASEELEKTAFVQYLEKRSPKSDVDTTLKCISLRRATDDGKDYFVETPTTFHIEVGLWYGIVPFSYICSVHHVDRSNHPLSPLQPQLP